MQEPSLPPIRRSPDLSVDYDAPVLVAVLNDPADLVRARDRHWYRIPLNAPARRLAADYIAFYHTGSFPPDQRWAVHYYAPVRGYHIATRRDLIPEEPDHPRAGTRYYRVDLGPLTPLPVPIPSRRLRRVTFIHTTLERLLDAVEINDLWVKTPAQQRLWDLLREAEIEAEVDYPLVDDSAVDPVGSVAPDLEAWADNPSTADLALFCHEGRIALLLAGEGARGTLAEPPALAYPLARGDWLAVSMSASDLESDPSGWLARITALITQHGGMDNGRPTLDRR